MYRISPSGITKQYNRCMAREEQYYFNIPNFLYKTDWLDGGALYKLPFWHPFRMVMLFLFYNYLVLVPYTYINIFIFRRRQHSLNRFGKDEMNMRHRNIVSTGYNMAVWFLEALVMILVRSFDSWFTGWAQLNLSILLNIIYLKMKTWRNPVLNATHYYNLTFL